MKEGDYTVINGYEYKISIWTDMSDIRNVRNIYRITTKDKDAVDDSFTFDKISNEYYREVDPQTLGPVLKYSISYSYMGHPVCCVGKAGNNITLGLGMQDKEIAATLGFKETDRGVYTKTVDVSEVAMQQDTPQEVYFN